MSSGFSPILASWTRIASSLVIFRPKPLASGPHQPSGSVIVLSLLPVSNITLPWMFDHIEADRRQSMLPVPPICSAALGKPPSEPEVEDVELGPFLGDRGRSRLRKEAKTSQRTHATQESSIHGCSLLLLLYE